jgi:Tfp pilus tip-associated adhesin PilY1
MIDIGTGHLVSRIMLDCEPSGLGGVPSGQPAVIDSDGNGYIDRFYIGTDKGYLYKVNIPDDPNSLKYSISQCVINRSYYSQTSSTEVPSDRQYQPIYGSPVVSVDNSVNESGNIDYKVLIFYGTGDSPYYAEDINMSGTRYYFLAYNDRSEKGACNDSLVSLDWFYELPEGHRVFTSAFSAAGLIYFGTSTADTDDPCAGDSANNNNGEIFAFSMHQPGSLPPVPAFRQRVGNVVASPMVEDQHLYVKGIGLGLQSFGSGIYNNQVLTGGWPDIAIRLWREIF